jgi:DtxR family Mn-dependent transcriptional regulator
MPSITVENYVKEIYLEQQRSGATLVPMGRLAEIMGVAPGTMTTMIKALADAGLVAYEPRQGARLTRGGEQLALHMLRRHRLVELFLVQAVGLDWSEVHDEAEELEHAISDKLLARIDAMLGHPKVDPHGDPIPTAEGKVASQPATSLLQCEAGRPVKVVRVVDQEPQFLQFLEKNGLTPGATITVEERDPGAGTVSIRRGRNTVMLGSSPAGKILVTGARA